MRLEPGDLIRVKQDLSYYDVFQQQRSSIGGQLITSFRKRSNVHDLGLVVAVETSDRSMVMAMIGNELGYVISAQFTRS